MIREGNEQQHYFLVCKPCKYNLITATLFDSLHTHDLQYINVLYS